VAKPLSYRKFRQLLGLFLCRYDPRRRWLKGDAAMRKASQEAKKEKETPIDKHKNKLRDYVDEKDYLFIMKEDKKHNKKARFCNDVTALFYHQDNMVSTTKLQCAVCHEPVYTRCKWCNAGFHFPNKRGGKHSDCFLRYHDPDYFGLCSHDLPLRAKAKASWKMPSLAEVAANTKYNKKLEEKLELHN